MPIERPLPLELAWLADWPSLLETADAWFDRKILPAERFYALLDEAKGQAVTAVAAANEFQLERVKFALGRAIVDRSTIAEFRHAMSDIVEAPWYWDTVFRTNTGSAFQAGHYAQQWSKEDLELFPRWKYVAIEDTRNDDDTKCPDTICRHLDGRIFDKTDRDARRFLPPLHFNCRCLTEDMAAEEGGALSTVAHLGGLNPPEGWDADKVASLVPAALRNL